jgi:hypothetical protein
MKKTTFRARLSSRHDSAGHDPQRRAQPEMIADLFRAWLAMGISRAVAAQDAQQLARCWGLR